MSDGVPTPKHRHHFPTTRWSIVRRAATEEETAGQAMADLCRAYWYPLYAYVRRRGHDLHDAQDLTQSFVLELIESPLLARADPGKGRFRSFMLGSLGHFLSKEERRQNAQMRGGGVLFVSIEESQAEVWLADDSAESLNPEEVFERAWAFTLLETVLARLRDEFAAAGKSAVFAALQPHLTSRMAPGLCRDVGLELGISENSVAVIIHRMRRRYGEILREEIARTVDDPADVADEIAHLMKICRG